MGEADSPGVIPQFAEELFERITMNTDADVSWLGHMTFVVRDQTDLCLTL